MPRHENNIVVLIFGYSNPQNQITDFEKFIF